MKALKIVPVAKGMSLNRVPHTIQDQYGLGRKDNTLVWDMHQAQIMQPTLELVCTERMLDL
jgi:hypothetical protein